jgi:hypothetical protein
MAALILLTLLAVAITSGVGAWHAESNLTRIAYTALAIGTSLAIGRLLKPTRSIANEPDFVPLSRFRPPFQPISCDDSTLRSYFSDEASLRGQYIDRIRAAVGFWQDYCDLDRGLNFYEWHGKALQVRVWTQSDYVTRVVVAPVLPHWQDDQ